MSHTRTLAALLTIVSAIALPSTTAHAGGYSVSGTCGIWSAYSNNGARMAVYPDGCNTFLLARNTFGNFTSSQGTQGGWLITAPPGAAITGLSFFGTLKGTKGWDAALLDNGGTVDAVCPGGANCGGRDTTEINTGFGMFTGQVIARVRCYATSCTNTTSPGASPERGKIVIRGSYVTISDSTPPAVSIIGGSVASSGWKRGNQTLTVNASDNVGIKRYEAWVDGRRVAVADHAGCSYVGRIVPCPNGPGTITLDLAELTDGSHSFAGRAIDSADNAGTSTTRRIAVDNHPPLPPQGPVVDGGAGWRTSITRTVRWTNPSERFAPIIRARYQLCPAAVDSNNKLAAANGRKRCVTKAVTGAKIAAVKVQLPSEGAWQLQRLWLEDAAGNHNPDASVKVAGLGYDATPPIEVAFADESPIDPARLNVRATDAISGIASGAIEVRRNGAKLWRPLQTKVTPLGLTAMMDDEHLRRGVYDLRAVAVNGAGLQQGTARRQDGLSARIKLPVRAASRLVAGRSSRRRCLRRRQQSNCRLRLDRTPQVRVGHSSMLRGQLTIRGKSVKRRVPLQVFSRQLGTQQWRQLRPIRTSTSGRFHYRAPRGPARTIRFRYAGTRTIRGDNAPVKLEVTASSTLHAPRRALVNGEYATFRGRLKGGRVPAAGALVELQVYARGSWRTFAQPRTDRTGRWRYQYRFETISGSARFRFRARIRRQTGYPFATGRSRTVHVRVRGL
jgi:hypothetical protein